MIETSYHDIWRSFFGVYDSGVGDEEKTFIFASQDALQFLVNCEDWYADGTFMVCPKNFF